LLKTSPSSRRPKRNEPGIARHSKGLMMSVAAMVVALRRFMEYGMSYIRFFRDVCSGGGMVACINHSIPPHKSNAQAVVLVPRFEKFATGSMAGQSKVHDAVAVLLGATSSAEVQDPAESFLEDVLEMVPSHISPWSWVVNLSPQDQRPRPLMRLSSSYINPWDVHYVSLCGFVQKWGVPDIIHLNGANLG